MSLQLVPVGANDVDKLLQFELANQLYFERFVPPRPEGFLTRSGMGCAIDALLQEMKEGAGVYYLLWRNHEIAGRVNFSRLAAGVFELGYRMAERETGRGIATRGLGIALNEIKKSYGTSTIIAETTLNNSGSIRVMEKCGFVKTSIKRDAAIFCGQSVDLVQFELRA